MTMKGFLILLSILSTIYSHAQSINDYKYVMVDNQYEFQNEANEYRLNEMMVFEINKRGLKSFRNTAVMPQDFNVGSCNALNLRVLSTSGLRVKMTLEFVNCNDEVVFTTKEGISRTKSYEKAYREALRDAMKSMDEVNYVYNMPIAVKPKAIESKPVNPRPVVAVQVLNGTSSHKDPNKEKQKVKEVVLPKPEFVELVDDEIYLSDTKEYTIQSTDAGFNIFKNNSPIGTLKKSQSGCYLAVTTEFMGIAYKKNESIVVEYDKNGTTFLVLKKAK